MDEDIPEMPQKYREMLNRDVPVNDVSKIANCFEDTTTTAWDLFGELHLKLSPGAVENIKQEHKLRALQIRSMIHKWREDNGEDATILELNRILNKAKLIATKHRIWNLYRDEPEQSSFKREVKKLQDFIRQLVVCPITESEWTHLLIELDVRQEQSAINTIEGHEKIRQRLNIIYFWIEKIGYEKATIVKLHEALKKVKLRRVICQISGPEAKPLDMNEQFIHLLEDEWDHVFSKLVQDKQTNILRELRDNDQDPIPSIDDAFNYVMRKGNQGFHQFAKAFRQQCNVDGDVSSVLSNNAYIKLFDLKKLHPKAPHFIKTEAYQKMEESLKESHFLELHGLPGSGKSQCASAFASQFVNDFPMSIVWFLDCRDEQGVDDSLLSLRNTLLDAKVCTNNRRRNDIVKDMFSEIRKSDFYILLVFEDLKSKIKLRDKLTVVLEGLKHNRKAYVVATTRSSNTTPSDMFHQLNIQGFTDHEAFKYLMSDGHDQTEEEIKAAKGIIGRYSNLPLGIAPAKAYCHDKHLSYCDYLQAIDEELGAMENIQSFEDGFLSESDANVGKNIFATMTLALSTLEQATLSNRTINYQEVFSYAMYFHHEKIPVQLFKQIIIQPSLLSTEHTPFSDLLVKIAINDLLKQLESSSLGVVDYNRKDLFSSTVSTHRVVLEALKHLAKCRSGESSRSGNPKLLNALHVLTCYFQKDNRLNYQHNLLRMLMPHVTAAMSMVDMSSTTQPNEEGYGAVMLEKILYIRLLELKGFACTQTDATSEAAEPLKEAYELLIQLLCNKEKLDGMVQERALEGNGNDTIIKLKARLLAQYCESTMDHIPQQVFRHLAQTLVVNQEDVELLKRNLPEKNLHESIKVNHPLSKEALESLRSSGLALSEDKFRATYLAELLASIAYTRGRMMFYAGFEGDRDEHIEYLKLSYYITKEVFTMTGVRLLHLLISDTNGLLYLKLEGRDRESYEFAYGKYRDYLNTDHKYFEHGVLKEDGKTAYNQMRSYRQMIKANHNSMLMADGERDENRFEVCRQLKQLIHDHPHYAKTAVDALITAGNFCQDGNRHKLALEIYREVMDRVNNVEERYERKFIEATMGFCNATLKLIDIHESDETRADLVEAKQRCEKARVLVPRSQSPEKMIKLDERLEERLRSTQGGRGGNGATK